MTDAPAPPPPPKPDAKPAHAPGSPSQLLIDLGPVAVFVITLNVLERMKVEGAVFIATGVFIAATLLAIAYCRIKQGRVPPVLLVTGVLVVAFGGLTLALHDETFIKIKPTVVYLFYAVAVTGSVLIKQNVWKLLFRHVFTLPDRIWNILALRWSGMFLFLALLNEYIRHTEYWANARLLIYPPLLIVFALLNTPLVLKHSPREDEAPTERSGA